jgi:hypothetical protein
LKEIESEYLTPLGLCDIGYSISYDLEHDLRNGWLALLLSQLHNVTDFEWSAIDKRNGSDSYLSHILQAAASGGLKDCGLRKLSTIKLQMTTQDMYFNLDALLLPGLRTFHVENFFLSVGANEFRVCNIAHLTITHTVDTIIDHLDLARLLSACRSLQSLRISMIGHHRPCRQGAIYTVHWPRRGGVEERSQSTHAESGV